MQCSKGMDSYASASSDLLCTGQRSSPTLPGGWCAQGHSSTIEDVVFKPGSEAQLASVGDDKRVLLWDTRAGTRPATKVENAHGGDHDLHTVDWCRLREHMLATGGPPPPPPPPARGPSGGSATTRHGR